MSFFSVSFLISFSNTRGVTVCVRSKLIELFESTHKKTDTQKKKEKHTSKER